MKRQITKKAANRTVDFFSGEGEPATPPVEPPKPEETPPKPEAPANPPAPQANTEELVAAFKQVVDEAVTPLRQELEELKKAKPAAEAPKPAEPPKPEAPKTPAKEDTAVSEEALKKMQEQVDALARENREAKAAALREKLMREAGADLIPELVTGETEDEVKASIEKSKVAYQRIVEKTKPAAPADSANPPAPEAPAAPAPEAPPAAVPSAVKPEAANVAEMSFEAVQGMSDEEYAKNRPAILRQMAGFKYGE